MNRRIATLSSKLSSDKLKMDGCAYKTRTGSTPRRESPSIVATNLFEEMVNKFGKPATVLMTASSEKPAREKTARFSTKVPSKRIVRIVGVPMTLCCACSGVQPKTRGRASQFLRNVSADLFSSCGSRRTAAKAPDSSRTLTRKVQAVETVPSGQRIVLRTSSSVLHTPTCSKMQQCQRQSAAALCRPSLLSRVASFRLLCPRKRPQRPSRKADRLSPTIHPREWTPIPDSRSPS